MSADQPGFIVRDAKNPHSLKDGNALVSACSEYWKRRGPTILGELWFGTTIWCGSKTTRGLGLRDWRHEYIHREFIVR